MAPPDGFLPYGRTPTQANNSRDLGAATQKWRRLYLGTALVLQGTDYATTLGFTAPTAARTITFPDASGTVALSGADSAFTAAQSVAVNDALNTAVTRGLTLSHTTSNTAQAGVGAGLLLRAESGAGTLRSAGAVDAIHTDVTDGAEVSALVLCAGVAGTLYEVARFTAVASAVNGVAVSAEATGNTPVIEARGGDTNIGLNLNPKGAGSVSLRSGSDAQRIDVNNTGIGFFGASPAAQPAAVANAAGGATVDAEARTAINDLLARLRTLGIIAT